MIWGVPIFLDQYVIGTTKLGVWNKVGYQRVGTGPRGNIFEMSDPRLGQGGPCVSECSALQCPISHVG